MTGEVCIKCFCIPAEPQESLISVLANWLDTSSRRLSKSLLVLWLDIRDSTLNGWLDTWVLRCSMSRSPSDSFKLADADILLATSVWTHELQSHSEVSCKKHEAFDALKHAATTELSANQSAAKSRRALRCSAAHGDGRTFDQ